MTNGSLRLRRLCSILSLIIFCAQIFPLPIAHADGSGSDLLSQSSSQESSSTLSSSASSVIPPSTPLPSSVHVVISEVMWMGSDLSTADEWLEIAGISHEFSQTAPADIGNWTIGIQKNNAEQLIARFATGTTIGSGQYLIVSNYTAENSRLSTAPALVTASMSLPNTQLLIRLRDAHGNIVDQVDDGVGEPFAGSNPKSGPKASMERIDLWGSGAVKDNWQTATNSRGFDPGESIFGTPGYANNSISAFNDEISYTNSSLSSYEKSEQENSSINPIREYRSLKINELIPNPIGSDDDEWIELVDSGSTPLSLSGLTLRIGSIDHILHQSELSGAAISAGSYLVISKRAVGFTLPNEGATVSLLSGSTILDTITYPALPEGVSYGRAVSGVTRAFCSPTPGSVNTDIPQDAHIIVQSGNVSGTDPVTLNLEATGDTGATLQTCSFDFGDGFVVDSCNPPPHTMHAFGTYPIHLTTQNYCGNTLEQEIVVTVLPKQISDNYIAKDRSRPSSGQCKIRAFTGAEITEFMPNPSGNDVEGEWIELHNMTSLPLPLCGWSVDDGPRGSKPYDLSSYQIPAAGYALLPRSKTRIALNNDADQVRLIAPLTSGGTGILMSVAYQSAPEGKSYALTASGSWIWSANPTPGLTNIFLTPHNPVIASPVIISAALPNAMGQDAGNEWVELTNYEGIPHWLNGWFLQNSAGKKYSLTGNVLAKVQTKRLLLSGTGLILANGSDTLRLYDNNGDIRSVLSWRDAFAGEIVHPYQSSGALVQAQVLYVVDGDTIDIKRKGAAKDERVRLLGINALEITDPDADKAAYALKAKEYISSLLENKKIELEIDSRKDTYGRTLAYVFLGKRDINALMVQEGLAYAYRAFPTGRLQEYIAYESIAQENELGFWKNDGISRSVSQKIDDEQRFASAQKTGLRLTVTPNNMLVSSGSKIHVTPSIKNAALYASFNHEDYRSFSGSIIVTANTDMNVYAALTLPGDSGSFIRSDVLTHPLIVRKDFYPLSIFLNEVFPSPERNQKEWIEIWNAGDSNVQLGGWELQVGSGSQRWMIPADVTIGSRSFIVFSSDQTNLHLRNAGNTITLLNPIRQKVDSLAYPKVENGWSYARDPLAAGYCLTQESTPGKVNTCFIQNKKIVLKKHYNKGLKSKINKYVVSRPFASAQSSEFSNLHAQLTGDTGRVSNYSKSSTVWMTILSIVICVLSVGGWLFFRRDTL